MGGQLGSSSSSSSSTLADCIAAPQKYCSRKSAVSGRSTLVRGTYARKNARRTHNLANTKYKDVTTGSPRQWPTELLGRVCLYPQNVQRGFHTIIPSEDQGNQRRAQGPPPLRRAKRELWMQVCSSGDHQGTAHRNHYSPNRAATQVSMKYRVKRNQCQDSYINPNSTAGQVRK